MDTTEQIYSRKLLNTLESMFDALPMAEPSAKVLFSTACEVADELLPEVCEQAVTIQVPTPAAKVIVRGIILMAFVSDQTKQHDMKEILLNLAFGSNHSFSLQILKDMKAVVDNPSEPFSVHHLLMSEPSDLRFGDN